jgi:hypothetical protein
MYLLQMEIPPSHLSGKGKRPGRIQYSRLEEFSQDDINYSQQKDDYRNLVDAVHHSDIDVRWPGRVLPAEEITSDFPQIKELLYPFLIGPIILIHTIFVLLFHFNGGS